MLWEWNKSIFKEIHTVLLRAACKLITDERNGEPFDARLVTGVRESYGVLRELLSTTLRAPRPTLQCICALRRTTCDGIEINSRRLTWKRPRTSTNNARAST